MSAWLAAVLFCGAASAAAPARVPDLRHAQALEFRIEIGRAPYLLRIGRADLRRLSDAVALGEPVPRLREAAVVREDRYPAKASREVPAELARRAAALWRLAQDGVWLDRAGFEWDPALGRLAERYGSRALEALRDAPSASSSGGRAGVWAVPPSRRPLREAARFSVRCVEPIDGPKRCFRVWAPSSRSRRRR